MRKFLLIISLTILAGLAIVYFSKSQKGQEKITSLKEAIPLLESPSATKSSELQPDGTYNFYVIAQKSHVYQKFNNCGPATLSMLFSYFDIDKNQDELGQKLRPYQHPKGDNDDKSVPLEEFVQELEGEGLISFHRPNGDIEKLKKLILNNRPVVVKTLLSKNDDIGHYRIVRGFDDRSNVLIQDDSFQGKNKKYSYDEFLALWQPFNYAYLVATTNGNKDLITKILGEEIDEKITWQNTYERAKRELSQNPNNLFAQFNASTSLYHLDRYQESIDVFEKIQAKLSFRTLWYQIEPILAYKELGQNQKVFSLTDQILNNNNRAFSELYMIRGDVLLEMEKLEAARQEFEKAVFYNQNSSQAKEKLAKLGS